MAVKPNAVTVTKKHYNDIVAENTRLKEALKNIHDYIANPEHHDMLKHILDIDRMVLNALYGDGEGEVKHVNRGEKP